MTFVALTIAFLSVTGMALGDPPADHSGQPEMNGIPYSDFNKITREWELVTVRFRKDNNEMRFTYANPTAAKALRSGTKDFPDGSVFAKVGRLVESDPAFESSLVPSGSKRFQFMVRNKAKFSSTEGWGYALFDSGGKTFPGEPRAAAQACAACHHLAAHRGLVFSQFANLGTGGSEPTKVAATDLSPLEFQLVPNKKLPERVRHWLPDGEDSVLSVKGKMTSAVFPGTLDEVIPLLAKHVVLKGRSSLLLADDQQSFSLVIVDRLSKSCSDSKTRALTAVLGQSSGKASIRNFCQPLP